MERELALSPLSSGPSGGLKTRPGDAAQRGPAVRMLSPRIDSLFHQKRRKHTFDVFSFLSVIVGKKGKYEEQILTCACQDNSMGKFFQQMALGQLESPMQGNEGRPLPFPVGQN